MSKCRVYISGSRSLEFFNPGSINEKSDWDFYVPRTDKDIYAFMKCLQDLNVIWMTVEDELEAFLCSHDPEMHIDHSKVEYLKSTGKGNRKSRICTVAEKHGLDVEWPEPHLELFDPDAESQWRCLYIIAKDNGHLVVRPDDNAQQHYSGSSIRAIVRGHLKHRGKEVSVQLITDERSRSSVEIKGVFTYHSSCVQSFIGPYSAGHLYGKLTSESNSYGWLLSMPWETQEQLRGCDWCPVQSREIVPVWKKYAARGFKYVKNLQRPLDPRIRRVDDSDGVFIDYSYDYQYSAPPDVVKWHVRVSKATAWWEFPDGVERIPFPKQCVREDDEELNCGTWYDHQDVDEEYWKYNPKYRP